MTLQEMIAKVPELSVEERKELIYTLVDSITEEPKSKKHSISELRGLGAEIWKDIDVQVYIDELRNEGSA